MAWEPSKESKNFIGVIGIFVFICCFSCMAINLLFETLDKLSVNEPDRAQEIANSIIEFELPGEHYQISVQMMGMMNTVVISSTDSNQIINIHEIPKFFLIDELMMRRMQNSMNLSIKRNFMDMELVNEKIYKIRSQEVPLEVYQGIDPDGKILMQAVSGPFAGRKGSLMIMILGNGSDWNQAEIDAIINSMR